MDDALPANRYELRMRGEAPTTYTSAERAASAFHATDAARQPSVHLFARGEPELALARTSLRGPDYGVPERLAWRKEVDAVLREGEQFREAYYAAVESSLRMRLESVDNWVKVEPRLGNGMVWQVDRTLYDDLETLAFARPEKAMQAWMDHVGTRYDAPTFVDRDTGQVVTLADTASMSAARHLHEYRFGVRLEPEHSQAQAQAPAAQAAVPAQPDVQVQPRTQAQPPGKEQMVNEQPPSPPTDQQPVAARTEQANTVEPADGRAHAIDGTPVELIRYSRRGKGDDMVADLRGFNGKEQVIEARGVPLSELTRVVGEDAAQQIAQAKKRTGTLPPDVVPGLVEGQQARHPAALASGQQQSPTPAASKPQASAAAVSVLPGATAARASTTIPGAQPAAAPESPTPAIEEPPGVKARRQVQQLIIEAIKESLEERFVIRIGREPDTTEYRFRGEPGVLAFVDKGSKLATDRNEADVARGLVDLAQAKQWKAITLHGTEDFRRNVWREAAVRGLPTSGYTPTKADQEWVAARQAAQQRNTVERFDPKQTQQPVQAAAPAQAQPGRAAGASRTANPTPTQQGGPTKEQVMNSMRSGLQELNADQASRERVLSRLSERLDAMLAQGKPMPELGRYDRSMASQRPAFVPRQVAQSGQAQQVPQPRAARAR